MNIHTDAPHLEIYVHIFVGEITVKKWLNSPRSPLPMEYLKKLAAGFSHVFG